MWIEDTIVCDGCGSEVTLYTDGRSAYVLTGELGGGADPYEADGTEVWREDLCIVTACPAYERGDTGRRCGNELHYTGEGVSLPDTDRMAQFAEPILEEAP